MTKDKERDDALIAEKKRVAKELERMAETSRYATMGEQTSLAEAIVLLRGDEQSAPKPDRAEVLAGEVISAANIVSHGGYYELDEEAVTTIIRRHFDELRAEIEAERPAVVVVPREEQIKQMVTRFLGWKLPEDFHPDDGISFEPFFNVEWNAKQGKPPQRRTPTGTNLFTSTQAEAMVRYMLGDDT